MTNSSRIIYLGSLVGKNKMGYDGSTYDEFGICPALTTNCVQNDKLYILVRNDKSKHQQNN